MEEIENEKINNKILGICLLPIYTIIALFTFFIIGLNKVEAESNIQIKGVNHSFTGSVWNGSQIVKTYDSNLNNPYLGYTSIGNNVMYKLYFHSGVTLNFQTYPIENLTQTRWLYTIDVCTDIKTPLTYKTATSGNGAIITAYNAMKKGSCSQLGNDTNGILYTYPIVIKYNNYNMGTIYIDGEMVIDVDNGFTQNFGKLAVVNWSVTEFTEEIENQYEQINQNNIIINQNNQIINQNNQNTDKIVGAIEGNGLENTNPIDSNKKNELEEVEDEILNEDITTSLEEIDISIDSNTSEFIWNLITRIINSNALIFGLVLTMLSLGVLKLVLNR